mgnify:FL=1
MKTTPRIGAFFSELACLCVIGMLSQGVLAKTEVGPFQTREHAERFSEQLEQAAETTNRREQVAVDYIIASELLGLKQSQALLASMRSRGFDDIVVVKTGDFGGRVSAGVYRSLGPAAERRLRRLNREGFNFKSMPRKTAETIQFWVVTEFPVTSTEIAAGSVELGYPLNANTAITEDETGVFSKTVSAANPQRQSTTESPVRSAIDIIAAAESNAPIIAKQNRVAAPSNLATASSRKRYIEAPKLWIAYTGIFIFLTITGITVFVFFHKRHRKQKTPNAEMVTAASTQQFLQSAEPHDSREVDETKPDVAVDQIAALAEQAVTERKHLLNIIHDQVMLAQQGEIGDGQQSFKLDKAILTVVNEARLTHQGGPIIYRVNSMLPRVSGDESALHHLLRILIHQVVSFNDSARIFVQVSYQENDLNFQCVNESSLLSELELRHLSIPSTQFGLRLETAHELAKRIEGNITLDSKFGIGTFATLSLALPPPHREVVPNVTQANRLSKTRMKLVKSQQVDVPAAQAAIDSLASTLHASDAVQPDPNQADTFLAALATIKKQLTAVKEAGQTTAEVLEELVDVVDRDQLDASEAEPESLRLIDLVVAELKQWQTREELQPSGKASEKSPAADSLKDNDIELFDQIKGQILDIQTARAFGDLQTLSRVARWTAKYADGLGMISVASLFRIIGKSMRTGDELRMLEALAILHMSFAQLDSQQLVSSKFA